MASDFDRPQREIGSELHATRLSELMQSRRDFITKALGAAAGAAAAYAAPSFTSVNAKPAYASITTAPPPAPTISTATTDGSGSVQFIEPGNPEPVDVLVVNSSGEGISGVDVTFWDHSQFEAFFLVDPSVTYVNRVSIFPHNSLQTITMHVDGEGLDLEDIVRHDSSRAPAIQAFLDVCFEDAEVEFITHEEYVMKIVIGAIASTIVLTLLGSVSGPVGFFFAVLGVVSSIAAVAEIVASFPSELGFVPEFWGRALCAPSGIPISIWKPFPPSS